MSFFVYIHTCPNGKRYVGVTIKTPEYRWNYGKGYFHNKHFSRAIKKFGWDNIEHTSFKTKSKDLMMFWERILIYHYNTMDDEYGYNKTSGGDGCYERSDETKQKISAALKGRTISDEHKQILLASNVGKKRSLETRKRMSEAAKNRKSKPLSDETKRKLSEIMKGRKMPPRSEESRKRYSEATKLYWENKRKNTI